MWAIPHPDAAGTLYHASDDYKWFRVVAGFEKGVCSQIDSGNNSCGVVRLWISGDGQFKTYSGAANIRAADDTELQTTLAGGINNIMLSITFMSGGPVLRRFASSDTNYKYAAMFADIRRCWRVGQALSKLTLRAEAHIDGFCGGCSDVYVPWQSDWVSADFTKIVSIDSGNLTLSNSYSGGTTLFEFDMGPDGAAI